MTIFSEGLYFGITVGFAVGLVVVAVMLFYKKK